MRIELRDMQRRKIGRATIDPQARPPRVTTHAGREVYLTWDSALDDAGHLRRCIACGCPDLFQERAFPQVTGIVIVLAFAGAAVGLAGFATNIPVLIAMTIVLIADVAILIFSRRRLVCYQCRTSYHDVKIARYHRRWDRQVAERYPRPSPEPPAKPSPARTAAQAEKPAPAAAQTEADSPAHLGRLRGVAL